MLGLFPTLLDLVRRNNRPDGASSREKFGGEPQMADPGVAIQVEAQNDADPALRLRPSNATPIPAGLKSRLYRIPGTEISDLSFEEQGTQEWDAPRLVPFLHVHCPNRMKLYSIPNRQRKMRMRGAASTAACIVVLAAGGWAWMWRSASVPGISVEPLAKVVPLVTEEDEHKEAVTTAPLRLQSARKGSKLLATAPLEPLSRRNLADEGPGFTRNFESFDSLSKHSNAVTEINWRGGISAEVALRLAEEEQIETTEEAGEAEKEEVVRRDWSTLQTSQPEEVELKIVGIRSALLARVGNWGESMLKRTEGRWGWRMNREEEHSRLEFSIASLNITRTHHENETSTSH